MHHAVDRKYRSHQLLPAEQRHRLTHDNTKLPAPPSPTRSKGRAPLETVQTVRRRVQHVLLVLLDAGVGVGVGVGAGAGASASARPADGGGVRAAAGGARAHAAAVELVGADDYEILCAVDVDRTALGRAGGKSVWFRLHLPGTSYEDDQWWGGSTVCGVQTLGAMRVKYSPLVAGHGFAVPVLRAGTTGYKCAKEACADLPMIRK